MKRIVRGHRPGGADDPPHLERLRLDEPDLHGRAAADVDADEHDARAEPRDRERARHRRWRARRLDHDVEAASARSPRPPARRAGPRSGRSCVSPRSRAPSARRCACGSISVTAPPIVAAAMRAEEADRPAADHRDLVARVDPAGRHGRAVGDRERLDERALRERELVGNAVQPRGLRHEVLGVGAADREPEVVVAVVDDAFADDAVARPGAWSPPLPTSAISPDHSWPGMIGYETGMM